MSNHGGLGERGEHGEPGYPGIPGYLVGVESKGIGPCPEGPPGEQGEPGIPDCLMILGTQYEFDITNNEVDPRLYDKSGYCDPYTKRIAVENDFNEQAPGSIGDFKLLKQKIKRHEIIHAYFFESGLMEYAENEQLVDWIAVQFPKMLETFRQADAIKEKTRLR